MREVPVSRKRPEQDAAYWREYRRKNRERILETSKRSKRKIKAANPELWLAKQRARNNKYNAANREKRRLYNQKTNLKRYYGMTLADYESLLAAQGGKCAICEREQNCSLHKRLYVDHDHKTMTIRGLLCYRCNAALGQLGDCVEGLQKGINYLLRAERYGRKIA